MIDWFGLIALQGTLTSSIRPHGLFVYFFPLLRTTPQFYLCRMNELMDEYVSLPLSAMWEQRHTHPIFEVTKLFLAFPGDTWCMTRPKPTKRHTPLTPHPALTPCGTCIAALHPESPWCRAEPPWAAAARTQPLRAQAEGADVHGQSLLF